MKQTKDGDQQTFIVKPAPFRGGEWHALNDY